MCNESVENFKNAAHQQIKQSPKHVHFNQGPDNSVVRVDIIDDLKTPDEEQDFLMIASEGLNHKVSSIPRVANLFYSPGSGYISELSLSSSLIHSHSQLFSSACWKLLI